MTMTFKFNVRRLRLLILAAPPGSELAFLGMGSGPGFDREDHHEPPILHPPRACSGITLSCV